MWYVNLSVYIEILSIIPVLYKLCDMWIYHLLKAVYVLMFGFYINYVICELIQLSISFLVGPIVLYKLCDMWI